MIAEHVDHDPHRLLTPREAAARLNISERTLWGLARQGAIAVVRLGRATRYDPVDVQTLIASRKSTVKASAADQVA